MKPGARRAVQQQAALVEQAVARSLSAEPATVEQVTPGAARDGQALVQVRWKGALIPVAYPAGLSLQAGQTVVLLVPDGPPPFVLCRLVGAP